MVVAHSANLVAADITSNNTKCVQASADATVNKVTFTCSGLPVGRNTVKFLTAKNSEWLQPPPLRCSCCPPGYAPRSQPLS